MSNLTKLCAELKKELGTKKTITLPNTNVKEANVYDFISSLLKVEKVDFTNASLTCEEAVTLNGTFTLAGMQWNATWKFEEQGDKGIVWSFEADTSQGSKVSALMDHFIYAPPLVPASVSGLNVSSIKIKTALSSRNYSLDLQATTKWGLLELIVQKNEGTWGTAIGIALPNDFKPSSLNNSLALLNAFNYEKSAVAIANFKDNEFAIAGIKGVVKGIEFKSTVTFNSIPTGGSPASEALRAIMQELKPSLKAIEPFDGEIALSTNSPSKLTGYSNKQFSLPGFNNFKLSDTYLEVTTTPSVAFASDMNVPIDMHSNPAVKALNVQGRISFTYSEGTGTMQAALNSATEVVEPFGFYGVTLKDVGLGFDISFGAESGGGFTLEGAFLLGKSNKQLDSKFAITMEDTLGALNPTLLYCETKNLSLPVLFDALVSGAKLPSMFSGINFDELSLYWCNKAQQLPDGTPCQIGYGYNAAANFWGFNTYSELMVKKDTGITGKASINPVHLLDDRISLTGNGKAGHNVSAGGPCFDFNTTEKSVTGSLNAKILGLTATSIDATISEKALAFKMDTSSVVGIANSVDVSIMDGGQSMSFESALEISLDMYPKLKYKGVNLGTFHLDSTLIGTLNCSYKDGKYKVLINAKFEFWGESGGFNFNYDLGSEIFNLSDLHKAVGNKILTDTENIFEKYISNVGNYIRLVGKQLLKDGAFVVNVLHGVYKNSLVDLFINLDKLPDGFNVNGMLDFHLTFPLQVPVVPFHFKMDLKVKWEGIGHTMHIKENMTAPGFLFNLLDIMPNQHFDHTVPISIDGKWMSPEFETPKASIEWEGFGGGVSVKGRSGVCGTLQLTNIDFKGKLILQGEAYAYLKVPGHKFEHHHSIDYTTN